MTMVHAHASVPAAGRARVSERKQRAEEPVYFDARNPGRIGPVKLVHLIAVEVAIGIAAGVYGVTAGEELLRALPWLIGGAAAITLILVPVFGRSGGMWLYQAAPLRRKLSARRAQPQVDAEVLHGLAPDLGIIGIEERDTDIGVGYDDHGWFASLSLGGSDGITEAVPLVRLARMFTESGVPVSSIQIVGHTVPIGLSGSDGSAASLSYQELLGGLPAVVHHTSWLTVRMNSEDAMDAAADRGGDVDGVHKALAVTVSRVGKLLKNAGVENRVLDVDGVRDMLRQSLGLTETNVPQGQARTAETWQHWQGDGLQHVTYRVVRWPTDMNTLPHLIDALGAVPAVFTTTSVTLRPGVVNSRDPEGRASGRGATVDCLIRIAGDAQTAPAGQTRVRGVAESLGAKLQRLDGDQGPAAYASAPTGGGAM